MSGTGARVAPVERLTLWETLDRSLWGKPAGLIAVALAEFVFVVALAAPAMIWGAYAIGGFGYLELGPWYPVMIGVALVGMLALSFLVTGSTLSRVGKRLLKRMGAMPPAPGRHAAASSVLHDVSLAAGLTVRPRLYVFSSPFPNGFGYSEWSGLVVVGLSTGLVEDLGADELRAVVAHLVARAQAPASRWLLLATTTVEPFEGLIPMRADASTKGSPWPLVIGFGVFMALMALGVAGLSLGVLVGAIVAAAAFVIAGTPVIVRAVGRAALPGIDEWGDAKGLYYVRDPRSLMTAIQSVLRSDNMAAAGLYFAHFFAPTDIGAATRASEEVRIAKIAALLGAEGVGLPEAVPLTARADG